MEFNGLHNMVIKIRSLAEQNKLPQEEADKLLAEATLFEKYLMAYHFNKDIQWHVIRDNPSKYQTLAEHQREVFDKIKAEKQSTHDAQNIVEAAKTRADSIISALNEQVTKTVILKKENADEA